MMSSKQQSPTHSDVKSSSPDTPEPILKVQNITKKYPGTVALDGVNFNVYPGKVNVLLGENGAGKSTLMKIIAGVEEPTEGKLLLNDEEVDILSPGKALENGIGIIYQELNLCPNLSVAENVFLASEIKTRFGTVDFEKQKAITRSVMERLEQTIDSDLSVDKLKVGQQQLVEIARALKDDVNILIMDEPTSALSRKETAVLLEIIRDLTSQGVAVIYISHRLDECLEVGDYFTVLRDGKLVAETDAEDVTLSWIVRNMAGRDPSSLFPEKDTTRKKGKPLLEVQDMTLPHIQKDGYVVDHVSFTVRSGEIVGIYGLMGAGRTELLESIFGLNPTATGNVLLDGETVSKKKTDQRIRSGLMLIPEDRQRQGLVQTMSVTENMTLASLKAYLKGLFLSSAKEKETVRDYIQKLAIKVSNADQPIMSLSGGNQQKVIVAKSLLTNPKVLMMDEPTRGIDVGAKVDIFETMKEIATRNRSVLFTSSELKEVLKISDRVLVLAQGSITADLSGDDMTEEAILEACVAKRNSN